MLRYGHRWHDAANGPLLGEARLLCFTRIPSGGIGSPLGPGGPDPARDAAEAAERARQAAEAAENIRRQQEEDAVARRVAYEQEFTHRKAEHAIVDGVDTTKKVIASDVLARGQSLQEQLRAQSESIAKLAETAKASGASNLKEIEAQKRIIDQQTKRIDDIGFALATLQLEKWESGDMTPGEFLQRFITYTRDVELLDTRQDANSLVTHVDAILANNDSILPENAKKRTKDQVEKLRTLALSGSASDDELAAEIEKLYASTEVLRGETNAAVMKATGRTTHNAFTVDARFNAASRAAKRTARAQLVTDATAAVADARNKLPEAMPQNAVMHMDGTNEKEIWSLYSKAEKEAITNKISEKAGLNAVKASFEEDVESIGETLTKHDLEKKIMQQQRSVFEEKMEDVDVKTPESDAEGGNSPLQRGFEGLQHGWANIQAAIGKANNLAGIEWMSLYEWYEAFNEVIESIKEVKKRKSRGRIARAALQIGRVAALIPGMGGSDLVNVLDEQQQAKNDEVKDAFKKELGNSRQDFGFKNLFGDGAGEPGLLRYYHQLGDTNRTRAILEFAAGKGLLYEIEGNSWDKYMLPGGIPFRSLMPSEWTDNQVDTWFGNLQFSNTQGITAQMKAGEDFVSGRATVAGYLEPFKGTVNSLSLWFAKGVANKALTKVKEGEMSALLTLTVLEAWENNELFRRYVPEEWLDRLSGDSKQLLVGMLKYDKKHLLEGARGNDKHKLNVTHDLEDAHEDGKDGKQRLGPLVAAVRKLIISKDRDLDPSRYSGDERKKVQEKFRTIQAQVLACKVVTLPNGKKISVFMPELRPYHIQYEPNEMRDAAVDKIGDDFFIERSEIINSTAEVMQYVGAVRDQGFAEPTKARYFFSHIIDLYEELNAQAATDQAFARAAANFKAKIGPNLDQWAERSLKAGIGTEKLLTEFHSDQGLKGKPKRRLVLTLLEQGLISMSLITKLESQNVKGAKDLLVQYREHNGGA